MGGGGEGCGEGQGVCVGHSWTIFKVTTKSRVQGCKKVLLKETWSAVLIVLRLVFLFNIFY